MSSGLLIRLRPNSPWRIGPDSGDRDRVDRIFHSDSLYSAVTSAMLLLGDGEPWLDATARAAAPAVRFSSCFPFQGDTLFVAPPGNLWPPPASSKVRWKGARFVPLPVVEALVAARSVNEENWLIDGPSECLVAAPHGHETMPNPGPFRVAVRSNAAIDRGGTAVAAHSTACLEFTPGSGLWTVAAFENEAARARWAEPVSAAFRLLADSGLGGERSNGFGRSETPEITAGAFPGLLLSRAWRAPEASSAWWLLSLFHPAESDAVDWTHGSYSLTTRLGRVESAERWGDPKKATRMVAEGSVLISSSEPRGSATDVAPEGFPHPVYRNGFALAIPIPAKPEPFKPLVSKPEPPKPEPVKPEPPKPEPVKPEPVELELSEPELPKPELLEPEPQAEAQPEPSKTEPPDQESPEPDEGTKPV